MNGRNGEELDQNEQGKVFHLTSKLDCLVSLYIDMDPFDEALDRRIWSLADHRLNWNREIAGTRRARPKELETTVKELLDAERAIDAEDASPSTQQDEIEDVENESMWLYPLLSRK